MKERAGKRVHRGVEEETTGGGRLFVQERREKVERESGGFGESGGNGVCERPGSEGEVRRLEGDVKKKEGACGGGGVGKEGRNPLLERESCDRLLKRRQVVLESGLEEAENEYEQRLLKKFKYFLMIETLMNQMDRKCQRLNDRLKNNMDKADMNALGESVAETMQKINE